MHVKKGIVRLQEKKREWIQIWIQKKNEIEYKKGKKRGKKY